MQQLTGKTMGKESNNTVQKTLLCVDDETGVLRSLKRLFRAETFRVLTAESCDQAFAFLEQERIQVVMVDQRMPDMSGTQFLQCVKQQYPETVRVVLSGYSEVSAILEAINRGEVYRFLGKPWDDQELKTVVNQCFEHHHLLSENTRLLAKLQQHNETLTELNNHLEGQMEIRTKTLRLTQCVIECLPLPVLGVSAEGIVVLANARAMKYLHPTNLGESIEGVFSASVEQFIQHYLSGQEEGRQRVYCERVSHWLELAPVQLGEEMQGCIATLSDG